MKFPWVYIGNKVICINDNWREMHFKDIELPIAKKIYTIRDIIEDGPNIGLLFTEIINPIKPLSFEFSTGIFHIEMGFDIKNFQPLIKKSIEQDISIFSKILKQTPEKVS